MKVTGNIVAGDTKKALPFVNIVPVNPDGKIAAGKGATTDINGEFIIELQLGQKIKVSSIGYEPKTVAAADADMITLKPTDYKLKEVVVTPEQEQDSPSQQVGAGRTRGTHASPARPVRTTPAQKPEPQPQPKKSKKNLYIGLSLLFVGAVLLAATLIFTPKTTA